jgi:transposase-like protein
MADEERSITEIASELGVNHKTLYNWIYTYKEKNGLHEPITEEDSAQAENKQLK